MAQEQSREERSLLTLRAAIATGFELTTNHLWLILVPVFLDLFFWLGPRLSVQPLIQESAEILQNEEALAELAEEMVTVGEQFNLFTNLSVPVIGVPSLMNGPIPEEAPLFPPVLEISSGLVWLLLFLGLFVLGLLLSAVYFGLIARVAGQQGLQPALFINQLAGRWLRLIGLMLAFFLFLLAIFVPLAPLAVVLALLGGGAASAAIFVLAYIMLALYLSFSLHGLVSGRSLSKAMLDSVRIVRANTLPTIWLFFLVVFIIGLSDSLWLLADNGSWLTLISIAGHGFISTALVAATFVFYRDRYAAFIDIS